MHPKSILVVGGSSGIGRSIVELCKEKGYHVVNASRRAVEGVDNINLDVIEENLDLSSIPYQLDGLVYCPGSINLKPFSALKSTDFQTDFEINVLGAVKVIKACLKSLKAASTSSIILFSTVAVHQGMSYHSSVAASKGAVEGLAKSMAAEFAAFGIRVNTIAPSLTDTPLARNLLSNDQKRQVSADRHPLGRIGNPNEIAKAAMYLLSEESSWMTGQVIHLDGGISSIKPM